MSAVLEPPRRDASTLRESERLYEVVDGELVEKAVSGSSGWVTGRIDQMLGYHAFTNRLGTVVPETMLVLSSERPLQRRPDVAFISAQKWPLGRMPPHAGEWEIVPDLAVEVLSPTNTYQEMLAKLREYFEYGVSEVWIVSPMERLVQVFRSVSDVQTYVAGSVLSSPLLPGLELPVDALVPAPPSASTEE